MAHPTLHGYTVCDCIVASAPFVEKRFREAGMIAQNFSGLISQGCYSNGAVAASKGTHDGGGVLDLKDWTPYRADADVLFTACGWLDFYRPYGILGKDSRGNPSPAHHHVVLNGCPHLATGAQNQVRDALKGLNGLAGKGKDSGPRPGVTWQQAVAEDKGTTQTVPIIQKEDDMLTLILWCYTELVGRTKPPSVSEVENWISGTTGWTAAKVLDGFLDARCEPGSVVKAYADLLGRVPESQAVIDIRVASKASIRKIRLDISAGPEAKAYAAK